MSYFDDTIGERLGLNRPDPKRCKKCKNELKKTSKEELCKKCSTN